MPLQVEKIQVNIPFTMLYETHLERFLSHGLNPEIGFDAQALDQYSLSDFKDVALALEASGLSVTFHAPFMDLSPGSPDPEVRALTGRRFEQVLQLVPVFKPRTVVCHTGYEATRYRHMRELWVEKSLGMWAWFGRAVRDEGSSLMLENVYEEGPEDMRILFEHLEGEEVGFCLDTGHQAVFGRVPLGAWVEALEPFLGQLHLHDNRGDWDEHLALGGGGIDFARLLRLVRAGKRTAPVTTLEPHREEDLWPSFEYLKEIWPW